MEDYKKSLIIYYCGIEQCEKGHAFGPAVRTHYLIHFIFKGKGKYYENGKWHLLQQGQAFLIYPGESTYYIADEKEPWEYGWIAFGGYEVKDILRQCGFYNHNKIFKMEDRKKIKQIESLVRKLITSYQTEIQKEFLLLGYLYFIFSIMKENISEINDKQDNSYWKQAIEYIWNNYSYNIKIRDIARYIGIDRTYLYKIFIEKSQISPQQYLISYRIKKAADMLENTSLNITEIAYSCGFQDAPSFSKHFKKQNRITPSQYQKEKK